MVITARGNKTDNAKKRVKSSGRRGLDEVDRMTIGRNRIPGRGCAYISGVSGKWPTSQSGQVRASKQKSKTQG